MLRLKCFTNCGSSTNTLSHEFLFSVYGSVRVSNKFFVTRISDQCLWFFHGLRQMLLLKNDHSVLIAYSGSQTNALSKELSDPE